MTHPVLDPNLEGLFILAASDRSRRFPLICQKGRRALAASHIRSTRQSAQMNALFRNIIHAEAHVGAGE